MKKSTRELIESKCSKEFTEKAYEYAGKITKGSEFEDVSSLKDLIALSYVQGAVDFTKDTAEKLSIVCL